jgi:putative chitinase
MAWQDWLRALFGSATKTAAPVGLIDLNDLLAAGANQFNAQKYLASLNAAMAEFDIVTPLRKAHFLAQIAWESGHFQYVEELWGPTAQQLKYPGGRPWCGHGLIQITGEENHRKEAEHFGIPMDEIVAWLKSPEGASRSAGHYWFEHGCNELADANDIRMITRKINGGYTGLAGRQALFRTIGSEMGIA